MTKEQILAKNFAECKAKAIASITTCFHPECPEKSINSHILQQNGILSTIAPSRHLWQMEVYPFKKPPFTFKRRGINNAFSFNCFCQEHDKKLFKKIEDEAIDFNDYESCLLFTLRAIYNEIFRKQVNIYVYNCLLICCKNIIEPHFIKELSKQNELAITDLRLREKTIWEDLNNKTESFVFDNRKLTLIEICLSSFYTYDTSEEIQAYKQRYGVDMPRVSDIFINLFPYKGDSVLLMGYHKPDAQKVKGYFNAFFKENEKRVQRKLTNLILFQCETWVCSDRFYQEKIKDLEELHYDSSEFSLYYFNERRFFDLNFCEDNFRSKFIQWGKEHLRKNNS